MTLNDKDRQYIRFLSNEITLAKQFNDKDFWKSTLRRIDNIPRETVIKMLADLVDYFDASERDAQLEQVIEQLKQKLEIAIGALRFYQYGGSNASKVAVDALEEIRQKAQETKQ